jgi:D-alanine transaminase/branched-chain amino acid aminotransferase
MPAFFNQQFVNDADATLHVSDLSMQRGYAVFDFFRTVYAKPLFMEEHLHRFFHSAKAMHLQLQQSKEEVKEIIQQLIQQSQLQEAGIRLMLTGGYSTDSYHAAEPNLLITCNPVKTSTQQLFDNGITAISYEHQRELPHIKSTNYLMAVWLHPLLKEKGVDDVLYHHNDIVSEFPRANVFIVTKDNRLLTPARNILHGITRSHVLQMASSFMNVEEREIDISEVHNASEVFLTSTTRRVMPVLKMDDKVIGNGKPGAITRKLWNQFLEMELQMNP